MKISFLVTYYDQAQYVHDSLQSIFDLIVPCDFEVLVGDDGSSDGTLDLLKQWKNKYPDKLKIYEADRNDEVTDPVARVSNLRKELFRRMTGDFFCVLDGDDYYCNRNFILTALDILRRNEVSAVLFGFQKVWKSETIEVRIQKGEGLISPDEYVKNFATHAGACVFRTIKNTDFENRLSQSYFYDDNDIVIYQSPFGKFWYVNQCVYSYRQSENSTWNFLKRPEQGLLNVLGCDCEAIVVPEYAKELFFRYRKDILYTYFRRGNEDKYYRENVFSEYKKMAKKIGGILSRYLFDSSNTESSDQEYMKRIISSLQTMDCTCFERIRGNVMKELAQKIENA